MAIGRTNSSGVAKYTHPSYTPKASGLYKVTVDASGHVSATAAVTKADITALGIPGEDTNTTYSAATQSAAGLMSAADKTKLDGVATGANNYTHPSYTAKSSGLYKVTVDASGHVSAATAVTKSDITALGIPGSDTNTTYSAMTGATSSAAGAAGLVPAPAAGKQASFLRGDGTWVVPTDTKYTHPAYTARTGKPTANATPGFGGTFTVSQITSDATGHVTGATDRTITIPSTAATTSAAGLMSASDKTKLDGIEAGANKVTVYTAAQCTTFTSDEGTCTPLAVQKAVGMFNPKAHDHSAATTSAAGFMSASDKSKLDGIATGANKTTVDSALSSTSTNPVQNKVVQAALALKAAITDLANYLPLSGGTLTGKGLYFNNGGARVLGDTNRIQLETINVAGDANNRRVLHLRNSTHTEAEIKDALALYDMVEGEQTIYKLYGEHNKPTAEDIDGLRAEWYGTCSTAAATAAKVVTTENGNFVLKEGATVTVKFTDTNTANNITLNVDGTGAKYVRTDAYNNIKAGLWRVGCVYTFVFTGTYFILENAALADTEQYGITKLYDGVDETSTVLAATANSVKMAYELAKEYTDEAIGNAIAASY